MVITASAGHDVSVRVGGYGYGVRNTTLSCTCGWVMSDPPDDFHAAARQHVADARLKERGGEGELLMVPDEALLQTTDPIVWAKAFRDENAGVHMPSELSLTIWFHTAIEAGRREEAARHVRLQRPAELREEMARSLNEHTYETGYRMTLRDYTFSCSCGDWKYEPKYSEAPLTQWRHHIADVLLGMLSEAGQAQAEDVHNELRDRAAEVQRLNGVITQLREQNRLFRSWLGSIAHPGSLVEDVVREHTRALLQHQPEPR